MIDCKSFLHSALLVRVGREYWCYDAIGLAKDAPLISALLVARTHYKDIVWC